jgi:DNA-binding HxlR family transcriptional regulator
MVTTKEIKACFPFHQYAPFGKYQMGDSQMTAIAFTCGLDAALAVIGGKWKPLILFHLAHGTRRYGELRRAVGGVTDKMLIQQLKELLADGIIERFDYNEIPPKVEYSLTAFGRTLAKALAPLCVWGTEHMSEVEALMSRRQVSENSDAA